MSCPSCDQPLGLLRAEDATPGALFKHRCGAILVLVRSSVSELEMRVATEAEKKAAPLSQP